MRGKTIIIGISGPTASGKSLLANTIVDELGTDQVAILSEDAYYKDRPNLTYEERCKINYDHPDALDHDLLCHHLKQLQNGETIHIPVYNFEQHLRSDETCQIGQHQIIVIEGILLFADPKLREMLDIRIYMDAPLDVCLIRRLERDITERGRTLESVLKQYQTTVRPMYLQFIEPSKKFADIIVPRGGANRIAIEVIQAKMRELLGYNKDTTTVNVA